MKDIWLNTNLCFFFSFMWSSSLDTIFQRIIFAILCLLINCFFFRRVNLSIAWRRRLLKSSHFSIWVKANYLCTRSNSFLKLFMSWRSFCLAIFLQKSCISRILWDLAESWMFFSTWSIGPVSLFSAGGRPQRFSSSSHLFYFGL